MGPKLAYSLFAGRFPPPRYPTVGIRCIRGIPGFHGTRYESSVHQSQADLTRPRLLQGRRSFRTRYDARSERIWRRVANRSSEIGERLVRRNAGGVERANQLSTIDADLYQSYIDVLSALYDQVVVGGVIAFDEYAGEEVAFPGARKAVDTFLGRRPATSTSMNCRGTRFW